MSGPSGQGIDQPYCPVNVVLSLPVRRPFNARRLFAFLLERAIPGIETGDADDAPPWYARTMSLPHGRAAFRAIWNDGLTVDFELEVPEDLPVAVNRVRRLFDLDADPQAVDAALSQSEPLANSVASNPGVRLPGVVDPHELVIRAIVGQQISVAAARTHLARLTDACGTPVESRLGLTRMFPTPARVAELLADLPDQAESLDPDRPLRLPLRALKTLRDVSAALADGSLTVDISQSSADLVAKLQAFRGIGTWTASYAAMRVLNHPDMWLPGDVGLLHGARVLGLVEDEASRASQHKHLEQASLEWAPWRSYAVIHLWQIASKSAKKASS